MAVFRDTVQGEVPAQTPPPQPANTEPAAATAVSVMDVPLRKLDEQVEPQLIPPGALVTVPEPAPPFVIVSVLCGAGEKVAVTEAADVP